MYHTFIREGDSDPKAIHDAEVKRLGFLRRKLLDDLAKGEKIWVWRSHVTSHIDQVRPLLDILRRFGRNTLLWVVEADDQHAAGTIEALDGDFIKGYVRRFAPYSNATDIHLASWLDVCWRAHQFRHQDQAVPNPGQPADLAQNRLLAAPYPAHDRRAPAAGKPTDSRLWRWLRRASDADVPLGDVRE
jgi:hypothetical protein